MTPAGNDLQYFAAEAMHYPVCFVYAPAPESGQIAFERFRLSHTFQPVPLYVFDQRIDTFDRFLILR